MSLEVELNDENVLMKVAYLSDIFGKLYDLNLPLKGRDKNLPCSKQNQ